jgi:hypothetical protein
LPYQTPITPLLDRRGTAAAEHGHICTGQRRRRPFRRGLAADTTQVTRCPICDALEPSFLSR